jgi:hypothetical protein
MNGFGVFGDRKLERRWLYRGDATNVEDSRKDKVEFLNELNYK